MKSKVALAARQSFFRRCSVVLALMVSAVSAFASTPDYEPLISMTTLAADVKSAITTPLGALVAIGIGLWLVRLLIKVAKKFVTA